MMKKKNLSACRMALGADGNSYQKKMLVLLDMYRNRPCLWNRTHDAYSIKKIRLDAYKELLVKYCEIHPDATMYDLKHRLDTMRNGYLRELKKVILSKQRSSHPSEYHKPSLWYYPSMTFLEEHVLTNVKTKINCKAESGEESQTEESQSNDYEESFMQAVYLEAESDSSSYLEESNNCQLSSATESRTSSRSERIGKSEDNIFQTSSAKRQRNSNYADCIGKSFAHQMQDLDPLQSVIAHKLISDIIFYAKLRKLTVDSQVITNFPENDYYYPTGSDRD